MNVDFFKNAKNVLLEVEVNPDRADVFESGYRDITGCAPTQGPHYQYQPNKWGAECRIYFNADADLFDEFAGLGIDVESSTRPYRNEYMYRVNNCEFFWELIRNGYRIGKNT